MKLTHEQLKKALDYGEVVILQHDDDKKYIAIGGAGKDCDGDYRTSYWRNTIEEIKQDIGGDDGFYEETLKRHLLTNYTYIDSYAHAIADPVPKGTMVYIKENAKEECERFDLRCNKEKQKMIGKTLEIERSYCFDYMIYTEDKSNSLVLPRTAFTVITPQKTLTEEDQQAIDRVKELNKQGLVELEIKNNRSS